LTALALRRVAAVVRIVLPDPHDLPDRRRLAGIMIMSRRDAGDPED
jgi:hypothetical protein